MLISRMYNACKNDLGNWVRVNEFTHGPIPTVHLKGKEVKASKTGILALALTLELIFSNSCAMLVLS